MYIYKCEQIKYNLEKKKGKRKKHEGEVTISSPLYNFYICKWMKSLSVAIK